MNPLTVLLESDPMREALTSYLVGGGAGNLWSLLAPVNMTATSDAAQEARRAGKPPYSEYEIARQEAKVKRDRRSDDARLLQTMRRERAAYLADHPAATTYDVGGREDAIDLLLADYDRRMLHTPGSATFKKDTARRRQEYEEELRAVGRRR